MRKSDCPIVEKPRIGVVIPTVGRKQTVSRIVDSLFGQSVPPVAIGICSPHVSDIPVELINHPLVITTHGIRGASAQRNMAMASLPSNLTHIAFFDDDAVLRSDYLEQATAALTGKPDAIALTGRVVRDGAAEGRELTLDEMKQALTSSFASTDASTTNVDRLYGMNMVVRADAALGTPFDERLPLYSWLEDLDFSRRLSRSGNLIRAAAAVCVHQGNVSGGRTQHRRIGYSQVSNFLYLHRKGSVTWGDASHLLVRPLIASVAKSAWGPEKLQRRARLKGMCLAISDAVHGRITPERIVNL